MKMDFRWLGLLIAVAMLSACGKQRTASSAFEKASDTCTSDILPKRFVVKYYDGRIEMVQAESRQEFIDGFLSERLDQIEFAEHDFAVKSSVAEARANAAETAFADNWGAARVNVSALWQQNVRGAGVIVAIVDTGMDLNHPQLRKQLATNPDEMGLDAQGRDRSNNGVDDDGNGFVDDSAGYDFSRNRPLQGDYTGHGTHIAGIIAGAHDDVEAQPADYVQGMAPAAKVLPLAFLDESGSGSMLNGVYAIRYAVQRGAKVINASWGGADCSRSLKETIAGLESQGVILVTASGNDAQNVDRMPMYPASLDFASQIVVGAVGEHDYMAEFSNYGSNRVHIFAPGSQIVSTYPGGQLASLSGTSMATPFVTGAVALLLSADPLAPVTKIRQVLYTSATKRAEYLNASRGRMNLAQALSELRR
ncbi:MAG: S8 family serine peptidase [Bdellovibrionaceae bacterium]|nr:S8 family serine peptidase [Pseudobdellovibrionaceae bacterium]